MCESAEIANSVMTNSISGAAIDSREGPRYPPPVTDGADTTNYFAADFARAAERSRLSILERTLDSITVGHLERLAFATGAPPRRCLEMGAGGGSIARWLGERVAPGGTVVAADVDTS